MCVLPGVGVPVSGRREGEAGWSAHRGATEPTILPPLLTGESDDALVEEPAVGQHAQKARSSPRGHPPLQEPARLLRVTLVPERSTLAAWRPKRGHCGGTLALATVADTMRVISRSGEQLFARHQFGAVHMHRLEVCALTLTCSKAPCALRPAPCTMHPTTGLVQANGVFVGDATWRVESGLSPCDASVRLVPTTLPSIHPRLPSIQPPPRSRPERGAVPTNHRAQSTQ